MEHAAEEVTQPEKIQERAKEAPQSARLAAHLTPLIPYVLAGLLIGAGILFVEWKPLREPALADKIQRYLRGGLGIIGVLALTQGIDIFVISRVRNAVSRFNLRRVLRLIVGLLVAFIAISVLFVGARIN